MLLLILSGSGESIHTGGETLTSAGFSVTLHSFLFFFPSSSSSLHNGIVNDRFISLYADAASPVEPAWSVSISRHKGVTLSY